MCMRAYACARVYAHVCVELTRQDDRWACRAEFARREVGGRVRGFQNRLFGLLLEQIERPISYCHDNVLCAGVCV